MATGSRLGKINLSAKRGEDKRWIACAVETEAALSLWLYSMRKGGKHTIPSSAPLGGDTGGDGLRCRQAAAQPHMVRLLGDNEKYIRQDLRWYLGLRVNIASEVRLEESPTTAIEGADRSARAEALTPRSAYWIPGCGGTSPRERY